MYRACMSLYTHIYKNWITTTQISLGSFTVNVGSKYRDPDSLFLSGQWQNEGCSFAPPCAEAHQRIGWAEARGQRARIIRCLRLIVAGMQFSVSHRVSLLTVSDGLAVHRQACVMKLAQPLAWSGLLKLLWAVLLPRNDKNLSRRNTRRTVNNNRNKQNVLKNWKVVEQYTGITDESTLFDQDLHIMVGENREAKKMGVHFFSPLPSSFLPATNAFAVKQKEHTLQYRFCTMTKIYDPALLWVCCFATVCFKSLMVLFEVRGKHTRRSVD